MDVRAGFLIARELGFLNRARDGVAVGRLVPRASWGKVVLLRYCARPPFAADRLEELDAQRLLYRLPKPGPDGRAQIILSPLELIGHIATPPRTARARGPPEWNEDAAEHAIAAEAGSAGDPYAQPAPEYEHDQRVSWKSSRCRAAGPVDACFTETRLKRAAKSVSSPLVATCSPAFSSRQA